MEFLPLIILVACSVALTAFARKRGWPAPLLVTAVALAVSFIPGMPEFEIEPELILTIVLPPLLYSSSLEVSFQGFTRSRKHIYRLGVGLVLVTALAVGLLAWWLIPGISLPEALLLGAVVSPPDAVSAAAIGQKLGLPRHVMTVLSGESLINDAASLTLFKVFVAIVLGSGYSLLADVGIFGAAIGIGVVVGVFVGGMFVRLRSRIDDPVIETLVGLLLPFALYIGAEHIGFGPFVGSGVIAVVAAGLVVGFNAPRAGYASRLQERPVWSAIDLLLEGVVFALIGLQLKANLEGIAETELGVWATVGIAAIVLAAVVVVRPLFVFPTYYLSLFGDKRDRRNVERRQAQQQKRAKTWLERERKRGREPDEQTLARINGRREEPDKRMNWRELAVVSWTGMRGVVTLAAAASIPRRARFARVHRLLRHRRNPVAAGPHPAPRHHLAARDRPGTEGTRPRRGTPRRRDRARRGRRVRRLAPRRVGAEVRVRRGRPGARTHARAGGEGRSGVGIGDHGCRGAEPFRCQADHGAA
jgi:NhaP-type Na+/H+ or K+/H+ antiporter